jgi:nucleoside-triphosphatase THEP1
LSRLASVLYGPKEDCDALLAAFAEARRAEGVRLAGLVQLNGADVSCAAMEMALKDLTTGTSVDICQNLGAGSVNACRLDPQALAEAAGLLRAGLASEVDLVIINKFGRMESEGAGLIEEIGAAFAADLPMIVGVPQRFRAAWEAFSGGADEALVLSHEALDAWWKRIALRQAA